MRYPAAETLEIIRLVEPIPSAGTPNAGQARCPAREILPMVRPLPERRVRGAERQTT